MVLVGTKLLVSDNSGARIARCIKILGSSNCNHTNAGDTLVVSIIAARSKKKVSKHDVHKCMLVRQKSRTYRVSGVFFSFKDNSVVILNKKKEPLGNRVFGAVMQEIRYKKSLKIILLAPCMI